MNILLTGGTGYIGSHAAVVLFRLGHKVVLYDNLSNSSLTVLEKLSEICNNYFPFVFGDILDTSLLNKTLLNYKIEAVIHFAGLKSVCESVERPIEYFFNNVQGTISVLKAMQANKIKKIVFSSSATVYGNPQYLPLDESHPTTAVNPYGRSKLHIEEILRDLSGSDSEWSVVCLRYFNPIGAHESGLIGENPIGVPNNLMPYIAQVATGLRTELKIYGNDYSTPDGTGVRDYIHVMDLAEGHAAALNFIVKSKGWNAFNLGTGRGYSVIEMIQAFEMASGKKLKYRMVSRRAGDVAQCFANTLKASEMLNWTAKRSLGDMCSSSLFFQRSVEKMGNL